MLSRLNHSLASLMTKNNQNCKNQQKTGVNEANIPKEHPLQVFNNNLISKGEKKIKFFKS